MTKVKVLVQSLADNCECSEKNNSQFYQDHGACEYCVYVGEDVIVEMDLSEVAEDEKIICEGCYGKGDVQDAFDDVFGNTTEFNRTCDWCDGTGVTNKKELEKSNARVNQFVKEYFKDEQIDW